MMRPLFLTLILFASATAVFAEQAASPREKYNFNSDWLVNVGDTNGAETEAFSETVKKVSLTGFEGDGELWQAF